MIRKKVEITLKKRAILLLACSILLSGCGANNEKEIKPATSTKETLEQNNTIDENKLSTKLEVNEANGLVTMKYSLRNENPIPAKFTFPSAQIVDFEIKDESGKVVYQSSKDLNYAQVITNITVPEQNAQIWEEQVDFSKKNLPYGNYEITANFKATAINDKAAEGKIAPSKQTVKYEKVTTTSENGSKIMISGENGHYDIKGTYFSHGDNVFYSVEDGHNNLVDETALPIKFKGGSINLIDFNIDIPEKDLPSNGVVTLVIYEKNKDDLVTNSINIALQQFQ